ncbi:hypothetical protein PIB30_106151, partial [Stylosanthes scabra]|nr:hypothetical protein [Stylosanthes scabra]
GKEQGSFTFGAGKSRLEVTNVTRSGAQPKLNVTWFEVCGVTFGKLTNVTRFGTPKRDKGVGARRLNVIRNGGLNVTGIWS